MTQQQTATPPTMMPFVVHFLLPQTVDVMAVDVSHAAKMVQNILPTATVVGVVMAGVENDGVPLAKQDMPPKPNSEPPKRA